MHSKLEKLSSIEDRSQSDRVTVLPRQYALHFDSWPLTFTFNPRRAMVMTHTQTQVQNFKDDAVGLLKQ